MTGRDPVLDRLRGVALAGIILVNCALFAAPAFGGPPAPELIDRLALGILEVLFVGKFFLIFSFLFGYGFAAGLARGRIDGRAHGRRIVGLATMGALHAWLLFYGDILMLYAALGALLWTTRGWEARRLTRWGLAALALAVPVQALVTAPQTLEPGFFANLAAMAEAQRAGYLAPSFVAVAAHRASELPLAASFVLAFNGLGAAAAFLLGSAFARAGGTGAAAAARLPGWRAPALLVAATAAALLGWGLATGGAGFAAAAAASAPSPLLGALLVSAAAPAQSVAIAVIGLRLVAVGAARWLETLGRMTLTGYLGHSVLLGAAFNGWGLGLFGAVEARWLPVIALGCYAVLALVITLWARWFRFGPDEWLLRCWVAGRWAPIRRAEPTG